MALSGSASDGHFGCYQAREGRYRVRVIAGVAVPGRWTAGPAGVTMERHALEKLLAGDDEASMAALAALRSGATYRLWDTTHPAEQHAGVFAHWLKRMRLHGVDPPWAGTHGATPTRAWPTGEPRADRFCRSEMDLPDLLHRRQLRVGGLRPPAAVGRAITALEEGRGRLAVALCGSVTAAHSG